MSRHAAWFQQRGKLGKKEQPQPSRGIQQRNGFHKPTIKNHKPSSFLRHLRRITARVESLKVLGVTLIPISYLIWWIHVYHIHISIVCPGVCMLYGCWILKVCTIKANNINSSCSPPYILAKLQYASNLQLDRLRQCIGYQQGSIQGAIARSKRSDNSCSTNLPNTNHW